MCLLVWGRLRVIDVLLIAALAVAGSMPAFATETHLFDVPAEDAPTAIRDFASQAHVQILVAGENVKEKHLHAVTGEFSTEEGLRLLLVDSGLTPHYTGDRSIALVTSANLNSTTDSNDSQSKGDGKKGEKTLGNSFRLAQVDQGSNQTTASMTPRATEPANLQEVIVTAQKREELLQNVPVPVTVLNAQSLATNSQLQLRDYFDQVPGLMVTPNPSNQQTLAVRGITTGDTQAATTGILIDDAPFGGSVGLGSAGLVPDIDPGDLARVEVLRGPQGTLYGASSMGGLIKFVTKDPSPTDYGGPPGTGFYEGQNGAQPGFYLRGSA